MPSQAGGQPTRSDSALLDALKKLRESPKGEIPDDELELFFLRVTKPENGPPEPHWYCERALPVVRESATFLIRLFAHAEIEPVLIYKEGLRKVLATCQECVCSFQEAKISSRSSYLKPFREDVLDSFFQALDASEAAMVKKSIQENPGEDAPPSLLLLVLINPNITIFSDLDILLTLLTSPPKLTFLPAGLMLLLFHRAPNIRIWARGAMKDLKLLTGKAFAPSFYQLSLEKIFRHLSAIHETSRIADESNGSTFFTERIDTFWGSMPLLLRPLNLELITGKIGIIPVILSHLNDSGDHFPYVIMSFRLLLAQKSSHLWQTVASTSLVDQKNASDLSYPSIIFDAIKDNPAFLNLIESQSDGQVELAGVWSLTVLVTFTVKVAEDNQPAFPDVLAKMAAFTLEELQHTRFKAASPYAVQAMMKTISDIGKDAAKISTAIQDVLERHDDFISSVAFSQSYQSFEEQWKAARQSSRDTLFRIIKGDCTRVARSIKQISNAVGSKDPLSDATHSVLEQILRVRPQFWVKISEKLAPSDHDALRKLLSSMAQTAPFSLLEVAAYESSDPTKQLKLKPSVEAVNAFLKQSRQGFITFVTKSSELSSSASLLRLIQEPDVVENIITLILSPDSALQQAALALVSQGYDVEERSECLRCLFENFPEQALKALIACLMIFNEHVETLQEASDFAQAVMLVLNDVLDVLCSQPSGLLLRADLQSKMVGRSRDASIAELWKLMTQSMSNLFTAITNWSRILPKKKQSLILLIRDSLIFAREIIDQRQVIRKVLDLEHQSMLDLSSPRKLSRKGVQMIQDLQPVLTASLKLLRLTDMELLHQSCRLVESLFDVFHESHIPPLPESIEKLKRVLDQTRSTQASKKNVDMQSRLNESQISSLTLKIAEPTSDDEDEEVTFLGITEKPQAVKKKKSLTATTSKIPSRETAASTSIAQVRTSGIKHGESSRAHSKLDGTAASAAKGAPILPAKASTSVPPAIQARKSSKSIPTSDPRQPAKPSITPASSRPASSSSESESGGEQGIAALDKHQKSPVKVKERRGIKLLDMPAKTNNIARPRFTPQEEAQRQAMRLKPDVSGLYKMILQWDYEHGGPSPPDFEKMKAQLQIVPSTFKSPEHYSRIFEPLLRLECWSQLMKSKDEPLDQVRCKVLTKGYVDQFLEVQVSVPHPPDVNWFVSDTDIILLRRATGGKGLLAKVQEMKRAKGIIILLRFYNTSMLQKESPSAEHDYHMSRVFSLSTINREYAALKALPFYDLSEDILVGRITKAVPPSPVDVRRTMEMQKVNQPQAISILSSLSTNGFSLIQGPPGTGKTSTICGIIGAFISSRPAQATQLQVGKLTGSGERAPKKKILLCAPSNAAIDEVAKRIRDGVRDATGRLLKLSVVRIGADSSINLSVKDISLDYMVDQQLAGAKEEATGSSNDPAQIASLRSSLEGLKKQKQAKIEELNNLRNNTARAAELEKNISQLNGERQRFIQRLNKMQDDQKARNRALDATRRRARLQVLLDADVICSTLSGSGHEVLEQFEFDTVVIDEAAQSIELSSLIPLKYRCTRCILVGDPKQLPPTVLSPMATQFHYNRSLFSRLECLRRDAVHLLSIQYRMHPDISKLPSRLFYGGRLFDGPDMPDKTQQPWHANPMFHPYRFFDVRDGNEEGAAAGHSLMNRGECRVAVSLYRRLKTEFSHVNFDFRIGVVSMYRAQIQQLKSAFRTEFGKDIVGKIDFNTVDGFQGQEKDIIILSCVRGGPSVTSIGFLRDERRMNVSITRARSNLFILGHAATLERTDEFWRQIVQDARERGSLIQASTHVLRGKVTKGVQVDPSFFQRRTMDPPPVLNPKSTPKKSGDPAKGEGTAPSNLQTPRAFITSQKGKSVPNISASSSAASLSAPQAPEAIKPPTAIPAPSPPPVASTAADSSTGQTRALGEQTVAAVGLSGSGPPRPPPIKRKKKEPNLFIPKKRPFPSDGSSNPNAKRRQL